MANFNPQNHYFSYIYNNHKTLIEIFSFGLIAWFVALFIFLIALITIPSVRFNTLKGLANLKDRDEREEFITGKASSSAYIATLGMMIFLLFFSMFSFSIEKLPPEKAINNHRHVLKMSFQYNNNQIRSAHDGVMLIDSKDIFPSTTTIILILIGWQLLAFNIAARKNEANLI
jgi:hypothetical protein